MNKSSLIFKTSLVNGLITGIVFSVITALIYLLDINMFSIWFGVASMVVNMTILVFAIILTIKKVRDGVVDQTLNYGGRFLSGLIVGVLAGWISGLFSYLLFNVIDPNYMLSQVEGFAETLIGYGVPEDDAFEQVDKMIEGLEPIEQLKTNLLKVPAFFIVISLIVSTFIKSKKAESIETT